MSKDIFAPFVGPFRYDPAGSYILDHKNHMTVDIRGFGFLTSELRLSDDEAAAVQDRIGNELASRMNSDEPRYTAGEIAEYAGYCATKNLHPTMHIHHAIDGISAFTARNKESK